MNSAFGYGASPARAGGAATRMPTEITVSGTGSVALHARRRRTSAPPSKTNAADAADAVAANNATYDRVVGALVQARRRAHRRHACLLQRQLQSEPPQPAPRTRRTLRLHRARADSASRCATSAKPGASSMRARASGATTIDGVSFGIADPERARTKRRASGGRCARNGARRSRRQPVCTSPESGRIDLGGGGGIAAADDAHGRAGTARRRSSISRT